MAAKHGIAGLIYEIRVPVLLAVLWAVLGLATESVIPSSSTIDALWLTVRVAFVAAAGFLATRSGRFGLQGIKQTPSLERRWPRHSQVVKDCRRDIQKAHGLIDPGRKDA